MAGENKGRPHGQKTKISVSPSTDLLRWVHERIGDGKEFNSVTHAVERGWRILQEIEEGKWTRARRR